MAPHDNRCFFSGPVRGAGRSGGRFRGAELPSRSFRSVGSSAAVTLGAADADCVESVIEHIREIFNRLECKMSYYRPDSPISKLSRIAGVAPFEVPEDTDRVHELDQHCASPDAVTADVLSTASIVAGLKGTDEILKKFPSVESLIVSDRYPVNLWSSPGLDRTFATEKAERRSVLDHLRGTLQPREPVLRHVYPYSLRRRS